ncbi:MAG: twin-arginine translocation signal domain-containing protein, partial [Verrucomicrobiota bacterium]
MPGSSDSSSNRRDFLKTSAAVSAGSVLPGAGWSAPGGIGSTVVDDFSRPDSLYHGVGWETQNPGYWQIQGGALRRRLKNVG